MGGREARPLLQVNGGWFSASAANGERACSRGRLLYAK